jgi:hypothetical protein
MCAGTCFGTCTRIAGGVTPPPPPAADSCSYSNDGQCDEPFFCPTGSDAADCEADLATGR